MWQKICLILLIILTSANAFSAGNRVALIIGNGAYVDDQEWRTLRNPPNDAVAVSNALRNLGFTVFMHTDLAKWDMRGVIADFGRSAYKAEVALFFFAGHGIQNKSQNFLMPIDVTARSLADAVDQGINLNFALEELDNTQSQIKIVMLDACRENPYSNEHRGTEGGLAPVNVTDNMVIVYSTQPGNIAADRVGGGDNSPFTSGLVEALQSRDLSLGNVLKVTSKLVKKKTGEQQVPYVNGPRDLDDFMLAGEPVAFEPEMVDIPAGCFMMGSPESEADRSTDEGPQHEVCVKAFKIGKYEITFAEYDAFAAATGRTKPDDAGWGRGRRPVINVTWEDAVAYTEWLTQQTGNAYRLPSEAEWEYAARAGTTTPFWSGECISTDQANYDGNYAYGNCGFKTKTRVYRRQTLPVGSLAANPWGLYDVAGNVWEWNQDKWHDSYAGAPTDGSAWEAGDSNYHLLRGGSWLVIPGGCRAAFRSYNDLSNGHFGFRVALSARIL